MKLAPLMQYRAELKPGVAAGGGPNGRRMIVDASGGGSSEYAQAYFVTRPHFETGDPRYERPNSVVAVAKGRLRAGAVECRVIQVVND